MSLLGSIDVSSISRYELGPFEGMSPAFSRVYTDPNCLLNMLALSLFPVFKITLSLRQDTPDGSFEVIHEGPKSFFGYSPSILSVSEVVKILDTYLQYASRISFWA